MNERDQLLFGDFIDAIIAPRFRAHAATTREKGRRYDRNKVCPHCFKPFTPKGWARHERACRDKVALTKALLGPNTSSDQ